MNIDKRTSINNADDEAVKSIDRSSFRVFQFIALSNRPRKRIYMYTTFREDTLILKIRRWSVDF